MILTNQHRLAEVVNEDARQLRALGLNGLVACQAQRVFFPTGVAAWVLGRSLWDPRQDATELMDDYFGAACGADGTLAKEFIKVSSEQLDRAIQRKGTLVATPDAAAALTRVEALCSEFGKVVERNLGEPDPCRSRSWQYLRWYLRLLERLVRLYRKVASLLPGDPRVEWASFKEWLAAHELEVGRAFDASAFAGQLDGYIVNGRYSTAPQDVVQR
jgi:hypothetical protein